MQRTHCPAPAITGPVQDALLTETSQTLRSSVPGALLVHLCFSPEWSLQSSRVWCSGMQTLQPSFS